MRLVGLRAAGGYGKSALGAKLCETQTGFDQVLWVAFNQAQPFSIFSREVLRLLGAGDLEATLSDDQVTTFALSYLSQKRYLVVLDNLETLLRPDTTWHDSAYEAFLLRWLERGRQTVLLLTSREQPLPPDPDRQRWRDLGGLDTAAGVALLRERGILGDEADLAEFVRLADGHPLLLNLTVGWLKNPRQNATPDVTYALQQSDLFRLHEILGLHRGDKGTSIAKVVQETVNRLDNRLQNIWFELSLWRQPITLDTAQMIQADSTQEDLWILSDRSLLQELPSRKFAFLPLIKKFAQQQLLILSENNLLIARNENDLANEARVLEKNADLLLTLERFDESLIRYNKSLTIFIRLGSKFEEAKILNKIGDLNSVSKLWNEALEKYDESLSIYRSLRASFSEASVLLQMSGIHHFIRQYNESLNHFKEALRISRRVGARSLEARALRGIGDTLMFLDQRMEALNYYQEALSLYQEMNSLIEEADTLKAIGDSNFLLRQHKKALTNYEKALRIYQRVGAELGKGNTLKAIGDTQQFLDQRSEALRNYRQALIIFRAVDDCLGEVNTLRAIGDVLQFLDQHSEALANYEHVLVIHRKVGDRLGEVNTLKAQGDVLQFLDQRIEALGKYEQALTIYREVGDRLGEANALLSVGSLQAEPQQAMGYFLQAQEIFVAFGDRYSQGRTLLQFMVQAQAQLEDLEGILQSLDEAAAIGREIGFEPFCQVADQFRAQLNDQA